MYSIQEIDVAKLKDMKEQGKNFRLIDVRNIAEIQRGCIDGCEPVPLNILQAKLPELSNDETYIKILPLYYWRCHVVSDLH